MFNLVFQPCAMAMDMATDHPCPHCPTESSQKQHHQDPQLRVVADCEFDEAYSYDSRTAQSKNKSSLEDLPVFVAEVFAFNVQRFTLEACERASPSSTYPGDPPLNILYCVYLI
jgi:hypothetical protein